MPDRAESGAGAARGRAEDLERPLVLRRSLGDEPEVERPVRARGERAKVSYGSVGPIEQVSHLLGDNYISSKILYSTAKLHGLLTEMRTSKRNIETSVQSRGI